MTLTSFDLVSDFDGSINKTFTDVDFDSAVLNSILNLGYTLVATETENNLFEFRLINSDSGDVEKEFVSYSHDIAYIEALTLLGYSVYESLTDAELNSNKNNFEDEDEAFDEEPVEAGKILAFEL